MYHHEDEIKEAQRQGKQLNDIFENILKSESLLKQFNNDAFELLRWSGYQLQEKDFLDMSQSWTELSLETQQLYGAEYQKWYASQLGVDMEQSFPCATTSLTMRLIPPGLYLQGFPKRAFGEKPEEDLRRKVKISKPFWCGIFAVTQRQWTAIMEGNPSHMKGKNRKDRPVESVTWRKSRQFCKEAGFRFLTEAQWEYACRAGTTTLFWFGDYVTTAQVHFNGMNLEPRDFVDETVDVGTLPANSFGLYEMHGNVYEWCQDWFATYSEKEVTDSKGPSKGQNRVVRGGSWVYNETDCFSATRMSWAPTHSEDHLGFRVSKPYP